jgi:hypothetical protein
MQAAVVKFDVSDQPAGSRCQWAAFAGAYGGFTPQQVVAASVAVDSDGLVYLGGSLDLTVPLAGTWTDVATAPALGQLDAFLAIGADGGARLLAHSFYRFGGNFDDGTYTVTPQFGGGALAAGGFNSNCFALDSFGGQNASQAASSADATSDLFFVELQGAKPSRAGVVPSAGNQWISGSVMVGDRALLVGSSDGPWAIGNAAGGAGANQELIVASVPLGELKSTVASCPPGI